jgi:hypothetical protein
VSRLAERTAWLTRRRQLLLGGTAAMVVLVVAVLAWQQRSDGVSSDCDTVRELVAYNAGFSEQTKASAQTNNPDLSTAEQYRQWAARIKDYAAELADPALAARAGTAAELAGKTADLVPRYRAKPEDAAIAREYAGIGIEYGNAIKRLEYACQDSD